MVATCNVRLRNAPAHLPTNPLEELHKLDATICHKMFMSWIRWKYIHVANKANIWRKCSEDTQKIQEICRVFSISSENLRGMMGLMWGEMEKGLDPTTVKDADIKMLPSFVRSVPNGTETGDYLALDLGGTNFRVLLIRLQGHEATMEGKIYRIPQSMMTGTGAGLFDHIASCLAAFIKDHQMVKKLPLGFTFSFPCEQFGLTKAHLVAWTKGFTASGVEGEDVVRLLKEAVDRRKDVDIDVVALLNDTTGTLMACAFKENTCNVGVIVGTGSNACYMERIAAVPKLKGVLDDKDGGPPEVIINTEWGAFGSNGCLSHILNDFDREVDRTSINPGKQLFEKCISGMYMGEIVRVVLLRLAQEGLIFDGQVAEGLEQKGSFPTKFVSEIEADMEEEERNFSATYNILEDLGVESISPADCANVAFVCSAVSTRAAHLCAAGIAVLVNRMGKSDVTVGVDGSVYRFHPRFKDLMNEILPSLLDPGLRCKLMLSEDGSGKGAALVAAVACRVQAEKLARQLQQQSL